MYFLNSFRHKMYHYDIYLVETFNTELASWAAEFLSAVELTFLCCTMRMPPAFTVKNQNKNKKDDE